MEASSAHRRAGPGEVVAGVDEDDVAGVAVEQAGELGRHHADLVGEQPERGQHLGGGLAGRRHEHESHVVSSRAPSATGVAQVEPTTALSRRGRIADGALCRASPDEGSAASATIGR